MWVQPEVNSSKAKILIVGRDPGVDEVRLGRPFVGQAGRLLDGALKEAEIERQTIALTNLCGRRPAGNDFKRHHRGDVERGHAELYDLIRQIRPNIVVACGNEACYALIEGWPTSTGDWFGAKGIEERRGYIYWNEELQCKVIATLHPASALIHRDPSGINEMLLMADLHKAKEHSEYHGNVHRPTRDVVVVRTYEEAKQHADRILQHCLAGGVVACDIEQHDNNTLGCIGAAIDKHRAVVFPANLSGPLLRVIEQPTVKTVWQNGQYDIYFLRTRCGCRVGCYAGDTICQWHTLWPEVAGKAQSKHSGAKRTAKSLRFLSSIYTADEWWKDYNFETQEDKYRLNGLDCCITLDCYEQMQQELVERELVDVYHSTLRRVAVAVAIWQRGMAVDNDLRMDRINQLEAMKQEPTERLIELVRPLLEERRDRVSKPHLIWEVKQCKCCGGGSKNKLRCWRCAGFTEVPKKPQLLKLVKEWIIKSSLSILHKAEKLQKVAKWKKQELEEYVLFPCRCCGGEGKIERFVFNPDSTDQKAILLYEVLKVPKRAKVDEATLKDLLGVI